MLASSEGDPESSFVSLEDRILSLLLQLDYLLPFSSFLLVFDGMEIEHYIADKALVCIIVA